MNYICQDISSDNAMMKIRIATLAVILSSFIGYLEWGGEQSGFLLEMEMNILLSGAKQALVHPAFLIPFIGQLLLMITLFQREPKRWMIYTGTGMLSLLLVFIFIISILSLNVKILASAVAFIISAVVLLRLSRRKSSDLTGRKSSDLSGRKS